MATKKQNAVRYRGARADASVASIVRRIERDYKLPEGSVRLYLPSGRRAHVDGSIQNLLTRWDKA
jgi:hypothetical protein